MLTPVHYSRTQTTAPTTETKCCTEAFVAIAKSCQNNANLYTHSDIQNIYKEKTHQGQRRRGLIFNNKKRKQNSPQTDIRPFKKKTHKSSRQRETNNHMWHKHCKASSTT
jgi:hypothetical protein